MWSAMVDYSVRILTLSVVLSLLVAAMLFVGLQRMIVRPLRRITAGAGGVPRAGPRTAPPTAAPADAPTRSAWSSRSWRTMRHGLRQALAEKTRLAALGAAMSRISHDLKNILATAVLISDRLESSADPAVRRVAPRLIETLDRAVRLCGETLSYARSGPPAPQPRRVALAELVAKGARRRGRRRAAMSPGASTVPSRAGGPGRPRPAVPGAVQPGSERGGGDGRARRRAADRGRARGRAARRSRSPTPAPAFPSRSAPGCSSRSPARRRRRQRARPRHLPRADARAWRRDRARGNLRARHRLSPSAAGPPVLACARCQESRHAAGEDRPDRAAAVPARAAGCDYKGPALAGYPGLQFQIDQVLRQQCAGAERDLHPAADAVGDPNPDGRRDAAAGGDEDPLLLARRGSARL